MRTYCGSGGIAPRILNLGTRWKRVVSFTPSRFNRRERDLLRTGWEAECVVEPLCTWWRKENILSLPPPEIEPGRPARSLVTILTELSFLRQTDTKPLSQNNSILYAAVCMHKESPITSCSDTKRWTVAWIRVLKSEDGRYSRSGSQNEKEPYIALSKFKTSAAKYWGINLNVWHWLHSVQLYGSVQWERYLMSWVSVTWITWGGGEVNEWFVKVKR
jgi:hypothetical protein